MSANSNEMAGSANPAMPPPVPLIQEAREIFPIKFDKDYLDFRGVPENDELAPKASSAPVSAETRKSPTGLEDVFEEDLVTTALNNVGKGTTSQRASGS